MCSVFSVMMCYYMLRTNKDIQDITQKSLQFIMGHSNDIFNSFDLKPGLHYHLFKVTEVIQLQTYCPKLVLREISGLVHCTPLAMQSEHCMDLQGVVGLLQGNMSCGLTCNDHSICFGCKDRMFWFADSLQGTFVCYKSLDSLKTRVSANLPGFAEYSAVLMYFNSSDK
jgi:hypothetical protein